MDGLASWCIAIGIAIEESLGYREEDVTGSMLTGRGARGARARPHLLALQNAMMCDLIMCVAALNLNR